MNREKIIQFFEASRELVLLMDSCRVLNSLAPSRIDLSISLKPSLSLSISFWTPELN